MNKLNPAPQAKGNIQAGHGPEVSGSPADAGLTELEMTQLCALAMGWKPAGERKDFATVKAIPVEQFPGAPHYQYAPLNDKSSALSLVEKFGLILEPESGGGMWAATWINSARIPGRKSVAVRYAPTINRAIVECAALMQQQIISNATPNEASPLKGKS